MTKKLLGLILVSLFLRILISFFVWHPDVNNHVDWGIRFWEYGAEKFYSANVWSFTWPNQPPGTIYLFAFIRKLFEAVFAFFWWINISIGIFPSGIITFFESNLYPALLKLPAIFADLGIAFLIYRILEDIKGKKAAFLGASLFLFNPVIWYNSSVWGQTDAVVNFFGVLSFYLLLQRKLDLSLITFALSLYTKASLLIFAPIWLIVAFRQQYDILPALKSGVSLQRRMTYERSIHLRNKLRSVLECSYKLKDYIPAVVVSLLTLGILTLPFSQEEPFTWLYNLYKDKVFVKQLQVITANAFNAWAALTGIHEQPHSLPFLGLTYQYWGYILFGLSFVPILYSVSRRRDQKTVIWALALTAFSSWMLLTNMHERYLYPLFPYLTMLVSIRLISLYPYIFISLLSLLNMYNFWWIPRIDFLINFLSFSDRLMPRLLGFVNFGLFIDLYTRFLRLLNHRRL